MFWGLGAALFIRCGPALFFWIASHVVYIFMAAADARKHTHTHTHSSHSLSKLMQKSIQCGTCNRLLTGIAP